MNNSDGTRDIIKSFGKNIDDRVKLVECVEEPNCKLALTRAVEHGLMSVHRFTKMANYRNRLLDHLRNFYSDYDYCIMIDWDLTGIQFPIFIHI